MDLSSAKKPTGSFISNPGNYDLAIFKVEEEYSNSKQRYKFHTKTTEGTQFNFTLYYTSAGMWWIKMLALSCGITEKELSSPSFNELEFIGRVFNVGIEKKINENNGKTYFEPNVKTFAMSKVPISSFEDVDDGF